MIEHEAFGGDGGDVAIGDNALGIRAEAAVAVGVEELGPDDGVFGVGRVAVEDVADFVVDAEGGHDFVGVAPSEVGYAASEGDDFAEARAIDAGGEHGGGELAGDAGAKEEEEAVAGGGRRGGQIESQGIVF